MAFKFIVKDEDLPKPTMLSTVHFLSILSVVPAASKFDTLPVYLSIFFFASEFFQIIYMSIFYKKIVWGKYASERLRTTTISFIVVNAFTAVVIYFGLVTNIYPTMITFFISVHIIFVSTIPATIYCRKNNLLDRIKHALANVKDFSFPFYKFTMIIPMFILLPCILLKNKIYFVISLVLLLLGYLYAILGEYFHIKRKDELDRLIKFEAAYLSLQIIMGMLVPLVLIEAVFKISIPWSQILIAIISLHVLVQAIINKKYE